MIRDLCVPLEAPTMTGTLAALDIGDGISLPAAPRGETRE